MKKGLPPLVLNSVSAPAEAEATPGLAPRRDYLMLARALGDAPILYAPPTARGLIASAEKRSASDLRQSIAAFRRRGKVGAFVSLSEKVGIPLALLLGRRGKTPHILVAHHVTSANKRSLQKRTGYLRRFDRVIVICRAQARYLVEEAGIPPQRVCVADYRVDEQFWHEGQVEDADLSAGGVREEFVLAVGRERRDYDTLARAAALLPQVRFVIVASSPWSRGAESNINVAPANVEIRQPMSWVDLRNLYHASSIVVVPLISGTMYGAGLTAILEAMAMAKPLIVTDTPGTADYVFDKANACVVAPDDPGKLAAAIGDLLGNRAEARRIGSAARHAVSSEQTLDSYVGTLAGAVRGAMANRD